MTVKTKHPQKAILVNGNESAAWAGKHINFHVMGYYPITPSTAIAEELDAMRSNGEHNVVMIPGDGEHGAAGISYGASCAGARVMNATSANGLLYAMEQLPVQSGTRQPMVLNVVNRSVSGPLNIKCDHSDIYMALNCGWIILMAKSPQEVYDMNIIAVKLMELDDVQLPVIVSQDGFFTSHQKRRISVFEKRDPVIDFIGKVPPPRRTAVDPKHPVTMGPYMNDPDLINNKYQQHVAMEAAYKHLPKIMKDYSALSGRDYKLIDSYQCEDAEVILIILNSPYKTCTLAVDELRENGKKVGVLSPNVLRPFPKKEIQELTRSAKVVMVADRGDSYGAQNGNLGLEIKAALFDNPDNQVITVLNRVYGIGGIEFYIQDVVALFEQSFEALKNPKNVPLFDYYGHLPGDTNYKPQIEIMKPLTWEETQTGITVTEEEKDGRKKLVAKGANLRRLTTLPKRMVSGHGACTGCGIPVNVNQFLKGISGHVVLMFATGCGMVVTTGYPKSSFRTTYFHNLFQNGAATLSGLLESYKERRRRGELDIPENEDITFIYVTGDGGNDIGQGPTIGTAIRNHGLIVFEYDNGGYMNTGAQLSFTTPPTAATSTSHVGPAQQGKVASHLGPFMQNKAFFHKDSPMIMAATHIPYVATVAESKQLDFIKKAAKAQYIAKNYGFAYVKALSACPLNWRDNPRTENNVIAAGVDCCYHPLFEIEWGNLTINYDPEARDKKIPVLEWAKMMGRLKHLAKPGNESLAKEFQDEVDRRWERLKAMNGSNVL